MPSINSILSVGYQALLASQNGINVTSNNIANASTEGYTRQRAVIQANRPTYFPYGALGTGASLVNVERLRDGYIDQTFRRETSAASYSESRNNILRRVETVLNEPGEQGLSARIDNFLNSWSEFATNPGDTTIRTLVRASGQELANTFQGLSTQIDRVRQEGEARLQESVNRVNQLVEDIRDLNREVVAVEAGGITATDLRDARDRAVDELAGLVDVAVNERDDGSLGVSLQGYSISDRDDFTRIELRFTGGTAGIGIEGRSGLVAGVGGRIGGYLEGLNDDLTGARTRLDDLAAALVQEVNALHNTGVSPNGATGIDFFDPAALTASSIGLSTDIQSDLENLAAATPDGVGAFRAGANDVALSIAAFRDGTSAILGDNFAANYRGLVSGVGVALRSSSDVGTVAQTLADNAANRRDSLSGVNTDEELVNLIRYQTAYQAAARIITTADEMLQTLLAI